MKTRNICFIRPIERGNPYWQDAIKRSGFQTVIPYKDFNIINRLIREAWFHLGMPKHCWFNPAIKKIDAEVYIVKDPLMCYEFLEWLRAIKPHAKILFDYDNRVYKSLDPLLIRDGSIEKWTYDPEDAKRYNMKLKHPAYFDCLRIPPVNRSILKEYDVVYVGRDKGRADILLKMEKEFRDKCLKTYFHISPTRSYQKFLRKYYKPVISYGSYLYLINRSKAILNVMPEGQKSITMRDLEAVFNGIKCITNNAAIKEFELYDKSRFFIYGVDDMDTIQEFLSQTFKEINEGKLQEYKLKNVVASMIGCVIS